jgi:hypothetical protein
LSFTQRRDLRRCLRSAHFQMAWKMAWSTA